MDKSLYVGVFKVTITLYCYCKPKYLTLAFNRRRSKNTRSVDKWMILKISD